MMSKVSTDTSGFAAARRGLIVQRVLVDGLSLRRAGAPFGVDEQVVARWVAAYRRHGMASLRCDAPAGHAGRWLGRWLARLAGRQGRDRAPARAIALLRNGGDALRRV